MLARFTSVPSRSTGSNTATGLIRPVLDADHSMSFSVVSLVSSFHLNAIECFGNFPVVPREIPYSRSRYARTNPSVGSFSSGISDSKYLISVGISSGFSITTKFTTPNPMSANHFSCASYKDSSHLLPMLKALKCRCLFAAT